jgi:hypothetical protein
VNSKPDPFYLDGIFNALAKNNTSVQTLRLPQYSGIRMNLHDPNSLKFIEKNSTLKELDFSFISFTDQEMKIFNESLVVNKSLTNLDLSNSNFVGPYEFLEKNNLKKFRFPKIFHKSKSTLNVCKHLKSNSSLKSLDFSMGYPHQNISLEGFGELIEILSQHENIEEIGLNNYFKVNEPKDFHKLLKNPNLKELSLRQSLSSSDSFEKIISALNENKSLVFLDISDNELDYLKINWKDFEIKNENIEILNLTGIIEILLNRRK